MRCAPIWMHLPSPPTYYMKKRVFSFFYFVRYYCKSIELGSGIASVGVVASVGVGRGGGEGSSGGSAAASAVAISGDGAGTSCSGTGARELALAPRVEHGEHALRGTWGALVLRKPSARRGGAALTRKHHCGIQRGAGADSYTPQATALAPRRHRRRRASSAASVCRGL